MDCLLYNWLTDRQGSTSIVYQSIKYREGRKQAKNTFLLLELQSHFERDKCQCKEQYVIDSLIRNVYAMLHYTYLKYYTYHKIFSIYITLILYKRKYMWPINEVRLVFFHMRLLILYIVKTSKQYLSLFSGPFNIVELSTNCMQWSLLANINKNFWLSIFWNHTETLDPKLFFLKA